MFNTFDVFNTSNMFNMLNTLIRSHELPEELSPGVLNEQLRPVNHEAIRQQIHHTSGKAKGFDAAEALAEDGARGRPPVSYTHLTLPTIYSV